jgi:hypothetical protein
MADISFNEGTVSIGTDDGKTNILKTGALVTTAVTANQVVLTYTVTAAKTFFVQYLTLAGYFTVQPGNANPIDMGLISLQIAGVTDIGVEFFHPKVADFILTWAEPMPIAAGVVIRVVVTPVVATSMTWRGNFGGYER